MCLVKKQHVYKKLFLSTFFTLNSRFWLKYKSIIHNNTSSSQTVHPLSSSHIKIITYLFRNIVLTCLEPCIFPSWFIWDVFFTAESDIMDRGPALKLKTTWWISFLQTHSFSLHRLLTDGLELCGLLWCFYQLFGLLFWRHPFTAEDPLVSKWCHATLLQIWWRKTHLHLGRPEGEPTVSTLAELSLFL